MSLLGKIVQYSLETRGVQYFVTHHHHSCRFLPKRLVVVRPVAQNACTLCMFHAKSCNVCDWTIYRMSNEVSIDRSASSPVCRTTTLCRLWRLFSAILASVVHAVADLQHFIWTSSPSVPMVATAAVYPVIHWLYVRTLGTVVC
jgi:hypothetical protein